MDQRWIFEQLRDLAEINATQAEQIRQLQDDYDERRKGRSSFWPTFWNAISAVVAVGALLAAILKP